MDVGISIKLPPYCDNGDEDSPLIAVAGWPDLAIYRQNGYFCSDSGAEDFGDIAKAPTPKMAIFVEIKKYLYFSVILEY